MPSLNYELEKKGFREFYDAKRPLFEEAVESYRTLLTLLLADNDNFDLPRVAGRVKDREECVNKFSTKYQAKLEEAKTPYEIRDHITDIIGLRVIGLYETDIEHIKKVIVENFEVLVITDKSMSIESHEDTFGYKGLHLDLKLSHNRLDLPEYKRFRDLQFEVQIRTIAQDAWSVLDHKIKYKKHIPHELKRRINRLAALFELADQEFVNIKNETIELEKAGSAVKPKPQIQTLATGSVLQEIVPTEPIPVDPFSFLTVASDHFPTYLFEGYKIDGFVDELREINPAITADEVKSALDAKSELLDRYIEFQRENYLNNLNPYTTIRHALYLLNKTQYHSILFDLQRFNFDKWLEANESGQPSAGPA